MKYINLLLLIFFITACSSSISKNNAFVTISNANQTLQGKLIGLEGKSLSKLTLKEIIDESNQMSPEDQIFVRYRTILKEAKDIKIYPREESFVMCMKWTEFFLCHLSSCLEIGYVNTEEQMKNPDQLTCK